MIERIIACEKYGNKIVYIDEIDLPLFESFTWFIRKDRRSVYVSTSKGISLHRLIMNAKRGEFVDHKNGNTLDNTRLNLRICTNQQNCLNQKVRSDSTTGYKGVSFHKRVKKFHCKIQVGSKRVHLGYFNNPLDGAIAYNKAAKKYYGEFARLNIIPDGVTVVGLNKIL